MNHQILIIFVLACSLGGCITKRFVNYNDLQIERIKDEKLSRMSLNVNAFTDHRHLDPENVRWLIGGPRSIYNKNRFCINSDKAYGENVGSQLASWLHFHFKQQKVFKKVYFNEPDSADFTIVANLLAFRGEQEYKPNIAGTATVVGGALGGVIGAVAATAMAGGFSAGKSSGSFVFRLENIKVLDKNGKVVAALAALERTFEEKDLNCDGDCTYIYENINQKVRPYLTEVVDWAEKELRSLEI